MGQLTFNLQPERRVYTVSDLTARIRELLAKNFTDVTVQGEISNCRAASSGHYYFTLKDERAQVRCVLFKQQQRGMKFLPEDGIKVTVRGSVSVYEARGEYQIYVESIEPAGRGALQLAFEQLKKRLEGEGLFEAGRKKRLPLLPSRIGLITSPTGAAVRDVVRILRRRFHNVHLTLYPVRVQGDGSAAEIVEALGYFNKKLPVDVILLVRGGGSLEDLWSFNEEIVARAIADSSIPIISGVGHETDFTIADFVADVRASTPSAAAEIVVQTRREFDKHVFDLRARLEGSLRYRILELSRHVHALAARSGFRRPQDLLRQQRQRADELTSRLALGLRARLEDSRKRLNTARLHVASFDFRAKIGVLRLRLQRVTQGLGVREDRLLRVKRERWERLTLQLQERSPLKALERGYAIATDTAGNVLRSVDSVAVGDPVSVRLLDGKLGVQVREKSKSGGTENQR
ncbi:MAG TPA: exodeoxyribonuclease VII large subunit [Candidatus Acidoferrum sp.]|nr:exodeoxyribonuclease VII large subunit [Candidatus Acidoferrum sp.]